MDGQKKHVRAFVLVMLVSAMLVVFGSAVEKSLLPFVLAQAGMVLAASAAAIMTKRRPRETFALYFPRIRDIFAGMIVFTSALLMQSAATGLLSLLYDGFSNADSGIYERYIMSSPPAAVMFVFAIMPAVCEELLYRGFALTTAKVILGNDAAVIIFTSLLFAAMHFDLFKFIPVFISGAALAYIAVRSGSSLTGILLHFINNSLTIYLLYANDGKNTVLTLPLGLGFAARTAAAVVLSVLLFLLGRAIFKSGK